MKKIFYHPIMKFLALMLFAISAVGTALFVWESIVAIYGPLTDSLIAYFFHWRFYFPVLLAYTIVFTVIDVLLLIWLGTVAGRSYRDGEVRLALIHKIPFDLYLCMAATAVALLSVFTSEIYWHSYIDVTAAAAYLGMLFIPICALLLATTLMSFIARFRAGTWWRNNIITYTLRLGWRIWLWCWGMLKRVGRVFGRIFVRVVRKVWHFISDIPSVPQALLFIASIILLGLFSLAAQSVFMVFMTAIYTVFGILLGAIFTRRLEKGAKRLADGDLECHVDSSNMFGVYRRHAEHLNHIREGMSNAVEAQLRSERMKTELITNVSHDIKTPLTSIINYVDLMKKESIESETVKEYLDIMDRQSTRLKKLIEDLIEVSKASTGNVAVEMVPTDVCVLLEQTTGEYRERLTAANLTLCVDNKAQGQQIMVDGKLLWRVFDNLLGNICKYSMPGTRVYLNVTERNGELEISLRNISLYSLNITSEELMERFVRGDRSRHTEGSGLGLSIAKNLVELQKGKLELIIDGDLFKAVIRFPTVRK